MLTDQDRALGHRLAGEWLERAAEPSAAVIAEHFDRGGEPLRAAACYQRAAAQALAANDLVAVLSWTERALDLGLGEERRAEVFRLRAEAHHWRGELAEAARWAFSALEALPRRSAPWYATVRAAAFVTGRLGQYDRLVRLGGDLAEAWAAEPVTGPLVVASAATALFMTICGGLYAQAAPLQARIDAVAERFHDDPGVCAHVCHERGYRELYAGRYGVGRALFERAIAHHERAGNLRAACFVRVDLSFQEYLLGAYAEALALVRAALADADRMGLDLALAWSNLGSPLHRLGAIEEAHEAVAKAIAISGAQGDPRLAGLSRAYLAGFRHRAGDLAGAEAEARQALERLELVKPLLVFARATLARVLLARGRAPEALAEARAALALLGSLGKVEEGEALARLVLAEALFATGDLPAARAAIAHARAVLLEAAARLDDAGRRESFLRRVEENARTLELARAWLHEGIPAEGAEALGSAGRA
ncbi:hypothetical protein [Sorangium sp. So ce388]|uniref:hypothetical protein n=1 Tax=Sorangium sp. So ce388 TaxID=3133309 RepID=UPI003F5BB398